MCLIVIYFHQLSYGEYFYIFVRYYVFLYKTNKDCGIFTTVLRSLL